ncbi:MAG: aryl-sulfate sulfotransferase [Planctomycetota bacterium]|nr:aryl-sulfate sulfotransferase [Planctomycetota bacterium]
MKILLPLLITMSLAFATSCSVDDPSSAMVPMPERTGFKPSGPFSGFTLFAPLDSKRVYLVDMAGEEVHHWDTPLKPGDSCYLTEKGTLLACQRYSDDPYFQDAGGHGGQILELAHDGEILWKFDWNGESGTQHHDLELLPNGNLLFVNWERKTRDVAIAAGRDPELLEGDEWWAGAVYEVRPTPPEGGEIVWRWSAMDHVIQNHDPDLKGFVEDPAAHPEKIDINGDRDPDPPSEEEQNEIDEQLAAMGYAGGDGHADEPDEPDEPEEPDGEADAQQTDEEDEEVDPADEARKKRVKDADWMHTNAVAYNADLDQIAISVRRFDEIWIIDHSISREEARGPKGDLMYRWGNPFAYSMGEHADRPLLGQHNVQWIPEGYLGAGNLIVFNNGNRERKWSTIVEWWAPRDVNGRYPLKEGWPFGPEEPQWVYEATEPETFYSPFISGVQRGPRACLRSLT